MLSDDDLDWLTEQIVATAELLGSDIKPTAAAMMADDLSGYPRNILAQALRRVRTEHTGRLTPKAIIDRIDEAVGRPAANEAWALAVNALDERKTVVWTDEMVQAWSVAQSVAASGDMVGARMAFISTYERLVRAARDERRLPVVTVSEGWDQSERAVAIENAVRLGHLSPAQATAHLPAPDAAPVVNPVALLSGRVEVSAGAPAGVRERLAQLRDDLARSAEVASAQHLQKAQAAAARLKSLKDRANSMVSNYSAGSVGAA